MSVASVALMFAAMSGARTMDEHLVVGHGSHFGHIIAENEEVGSHGSQHFHDAHAAHASHAAHHPAATKASDDGQNPQQSSPVECTCVGPCQGGAAPTVTRPMTYVVGAHEVELAPQAPRKVHRVHHDATSHLLPLPNAPPALV